jgi:hypothetical protein
MDVHCSTCGEPWDTWHLQQDLIHETCASEKEVEVWLQLPVSERLSPIWRELFRAVGWEFGNSILDVCHCACCPEKGRINQGTAFAKSAIVDLLGDDEDAIAAAFEDFGL